MKSKSSALEHVTLVSPKTPLLVMAILAMGAIALVVIVIGLLNLPTILFWSSMGRAQNASSHAALPSRSIVINEHNERLSSLAEPRKVVAAEPVPEGGYETYGSGVFIGDKQISVANWNDCKPFSEGLAAVCSNGKWGYVDTTGHYVVPLQFHAAKPFAEGFAPVCRQGKWGYIDKSGKSILNGGYADAESFHNGYARVAKTAVNGDLSWGFIDKKGRLVVPMQFKALHDFSEGKAAAQTISLGRWGFIDTSGRMIVPDTYTSVDDFNGGKAVVNE